MKIYFDGTEVSADYIASLTKDGKVYDEYFKIGATICENYTLKVNKDAISSMPEVITIYNGSTLNKTLYVVDYNDDDNAFITLNLEDSMTKFNFKYDASEIFIGGSTTLGAIFEDICDKAGVDTDITTFYKSDLNVSWYDNTYMARDYLGYIAEINGKNFRISADDKLEFVDINTTAVDTITFDEISDYKLGVQHTITRVVLGDWQYGNTDGETYYINEDNVYATTQETVQHIYNEINGFTYYNFRTKNCPLDGLNTGDLVAFTDGTNTYKTFVQFNNTILSGNSWYGGIEVNLDGEVKQETKIVGEEDRYRRIKRIVDYDSGRIDQLIEETPIISTEASGLGRLTLQNLLKNKLIELKIHPTDTDIIGLLVSNSLKVNDGLKVISRGITFDGYEDYHYDLPDKLYCLDGTYDEFIYDGVNETIKIIHRIGFDGNNEKYILSEPIVEDFDYYDIIIGDGDYSIFMETYSTAYIYIKAMIRNDFTTAFATNLEVDSKISQTSTQIMAEVNQKVDENDIIAKLNVAVENGQGIIELVGNSVMIDSDNFKLDEEGDIEANSGLLGDIMIKQGEVYIPITVNYNYNEDDFTRLRQILLNQIQPTEEDYLKYDFDKNGSLNSYDLLYLRKILIFGLSINNPGKILFKADGVHSKISVIGGNDLEFLRLGFDGIYLNSQNGSTTNIDTGSITVNTDTGSKKLSPEIDTYSTTETDTGRKWIDGKTIYRQVLEGTYTTSGSSAFTINLPIDSTVDTIISYDGIHGVTSGSLIRYKNKIGQPSIENVNWASTMYFDSTNNRIVVKINGKSSSTTAWCTVIAEYTIAD